MYTRDIRSLVSLGKSGVRWQSGAPAAAPANTPQTIDQKVEALKRMSVNDVLAEIKKLDVTSYTSMSADDKRLLRAGFQRLGELNSNDPFSGADKNDIQIKALSELYAKERQGLLDASRRGLVDTEVGINAAARTEGKSSSFWSSQSNVERAQSVKMLFPELPGNIDRTNVNSLVYALSRVDRPALAKAFTEWDGLGGAGFVTLENLLLSAGYEPDGRFDTTEMKQIQEFFRFIGVDDAKNASLKTLATYAASGKDVEQARKDKEVAAKLTPATVFSFLSDRDASGTAAVAEVGIIGEAQLLDILEKSQYGKEFFPQVQKLMQSGGASNESVKDITGLLSLVNALKASPVLKEQFLRGVDKVGPGLSNFLLGDEAYKAYNEQRKEKYKLIRDTVEKEVTPARVIEGLERKIKETKDPTLEKQYRAMLEDFKNNEASILSQLRYEGTNILIGALDGKAMGGVGGSIDMAGLFDLHFGLVSVDGKFVPGIGVSTKPLTVKLTENTTGSVRAGIMGVVPYLAGGIEYSRGVAPTAAEMLTTTASALGLGLNVSKIGWGAALTYRESEAETIGQNEAALRNILKKFVGIKNPNDIDTIDLNKDLPEGKKLSELDVKLIKETIKKDVTLFGIASLPRILEGYVTTLREHQIRNAAKKGYEWSSATLGVQFIGGFFPIPVVGASWEKISLTYAKDQTSSAIDAARRMDPQNYRSETQEDFLRILRNELGTDEARITVNEDGSITFVKPTHTNINGARELATEKNGQLTIAPGTRIRVWNQTGAKDAEFSIFLEKGEGQKKINLQEIQKTLDSVGYRIEYTGGGKLKFTNKEGKSQFFDDVGQSITISVSPDKSITQITSTKNSNTDDLTTVKVVTEVANNPVDVKLNLEVEVMNSITDKIYATRTDDAMYALRLKDGPIFQAYRRAIATLMGNPGKIENITPAKKAFDDLIKVNPRSLTPLGTAVDAYKSDNAKLEFALLRTYDLTLGSRASHEIGSLATSNSAEAAKKYPDYLKKLAPQFTEVWTQAKASIDMATVLSLKNGESLAPSTISAKLPGAHGIVGFNTLAQLNSGGKQAMRGLIPFAGDAPILGDVKELTDGNTQSVIAKIVDSMQLGTLPEGITLGDYKAMLKGDTNAKSRIEDKGYKIDGATKAYIARSGVPGAECTNPLVFITQPRLSKAGKPTEVSATVSIDKGVTFTGATGNDANIPGMDVSRVGVTGVNVRSQIAYAPPEVQTRIDTRDLKVSPRDVTIVNQNGQSIVQISSGGTRFDIPLTSFTRTQYIEFMRGNPVTLSVMQSVTITTDGVTQILGDVSKIKNLALQIVGPRFDNTFDDDNYFEQRYGQEYDELTKATN